VRDHLSNEETRSRGRPPQGRYAMRRVLALLRCSSLMAARLARVLGEASVNWRAKAAPSCVA
jgi:hypothetical protein